MSGKEISSRITMDINLSDSKIKIQPLSDKIKSEGGRYLTSKSIFEEINPNIHPLSPENNIYIAPGFLSGTPCPNSGRTSIGSKSPLTGGIKETNVGGLLAIYLAKLGIGLIKIKGKSEKSNVILIKDKGNNTIVSLVSMKILNGKKTYETTEIIQEKFGKDNCIVTIGPAGERGYLSSCICVTDIDGIPTRQAGRGGIGAVLGSKGIKAIVVSNPGKSKVDYDNKEKYMENVKEFLDILKKSEVTSETLPKYGTNITMDIINDYGGLPNRNFSFGTFKGVEKIGGEAMRDIILKRGAKPTHPCMPGCFIKCSNTFKNKKGEEITGGFEYECIWALGANCGIDDLDYIAYMNRTCDELGIDCIEIGDTIAVIMESGYISFGDKKGALKLLKEISKDTPLGKIVASGCVLAGKVFGVKRVPQVKGQGMPAYDPRAIKGIGTTYATSPMGADHTAGFAVSYEVLEIGKTSDPLSNKGKVKLSKEFQQVTAFLDASGLCLFVTFATLGDDRGLGPAVEMLNAKYGLNLKRDDLYDIGDEILKMEKEFNRKCGLTSYNNNVPEFFRKEKLDTHNTVYDIDEKELFNF